MSALLTAALAASLWPGSPMLAFVGPPASEQAADEDAGEDAGEDAPAEDAPPTPEEATPPEAEEESASAEAPARVEGAETPAEPSPATHGKLVGTVYRWGARDPVASARIVLADGEAGTETGPDGTFELWLTPGEHALIIRADGLDDLPIQVEIEAGQQQTFEYRLSEDLDGNRFRTVVEGEREVAISKISLRDEEIHDVPGTGGDPFGVIKSMPGTAQIAGFLPYVVVRGAAPGNTGYYLDGVRVPLLFHVAAGPSVIHPYFVDSVDFHLSGAPVRLGRFASGIVEGKTRPARRDRVRGDVDVRLTDVGALLEVPVNRPILPGCTEKKRRKCKKGDGRGALTFGGRYSYTGLVLSLIPNLNARIQFWDYQARFDHDIGPRVRYTAFAYGAYDSLGADALASEDEFGNEVIDEDPDPFLQLSFHRLVQRVRQRLGKGAEATYQVALGLDQSGADAFKTNVWRILPRVGVVIPTRTNAEIGFGLDQDFSWYRVDDSAFDAQEGDIEDIGFFLSERFVSSTGLWADLRWQKGIVELRPGIRADLYVQDGASPYLGGTRSVTRAIGVDPRMTIREHVAERWTLRQAIGMYHQPPDAPIPIPGVEAFGFDRGLQRNIQGSFGYEYWIGDAAVLTQDAYLGRFDNLQDFELSDTTQTGNNEVEDYLIRVSGWAYGLETMVRLAPTLRVYGWVAYTLSRSTRDFPVGGVVPGSWDQTHIVNLVLGYKLGNKWRIGGRIHFNSGRPYTRLTNANARTAAAEGASPQLVALRDNRNNERLPPFFQFDLRAERVFLFKTWQMHAYIDAANATLSREVFACGTGRDDNGDGVVDEATRDTWGCAQPQALRYILPTLGLRGRF